MVCEHLAPLEKALLEDGVRVTYRGQAWSKNCREWVYFDVILDIDAIMERFSLPSCVRFHENTDERSGLERGLECSVDSAEKAYGCFGGGGVEGLAWRMRESCWR
ncbi:hypothetical protein JXA88_12275, partial [Candidatus Fermentibacteria bacterium]|nr:hypothetical protein [Candidatus Fermentibacteria bacterium]